MKPPIKFILHVVVGTAIYVVIAIAALCLDWGVHWAGVHGSSTGIVNTLKLLAYCLLVADFFLLLGFLWYGIIENLGMGHSGPTKKRGLNRIIIKVVIVTLVVLIAAITLSVLPINNTRPHIRITQVPRFDAGGSIDVSPDQIKGDVLGIDNPSEYSVVLFAYTDSWHLQPKIENYLTGINSDYTWESPTHLGSVYAAVLVKGKAFTYHDQEMALPSIANENVLDSVELKGVP